MFVQPPLEHPIGWKLKSVQIIQTTLPVGFLVGSPIQIPLYWLVHKDSVSCFLILPNHTQPTKLIFTQLGLLLVIFCWWFSRWWFQTFFIFTPIWVRFPFWLIFFRWVETTNQFLFALKMNTPQPCHWPTNVFKNKTCDLRTQRLEANSMTRISMCWGIN